MYNDFSNQIEAVLSDFQVGIFQGFLHIFGLSDFLFIFFFSFPSNDIRFLNMENKMIEDIKKQNTFEK